jgi:hypothetical protein
MDRSQTRVVKLRIVVYFSSTRVVGSKLSLAIISVLNLCLCCPVSLQPLRCFDLPSKNLADYVRFEVFTAVTMKNDC